MFPGSSKLNQELLYSLMYPRTVRLQARLDVNNSYYFLKNKARISLFFRHYSDYTKFVVNSWPSLDCLDSGIGSHDTCMIIVHGELPWAIFRVLSLCWKSCSHRECKQSITVLLLQACCHLRVQRQLLRLAQLLTYWQNALSPCSVSTASQHGCCHIH